MFQSESASEPALAIWHCKKAPDAYQVIKLFAASSLESVAAEN